MMLKSINLGIAFLLELCMLAALAYGGYQAGGSMPLNIGLGIAAPLLIAIFWGVYMAPRAQRRLTGMAYMVAKWIIIAIAVFVLVLVEQSTLAILFAVVSVMNQALLLMWHQN